MKCAVALAVALCCALAAPPAWAADGLDASNMLKAGEPAPHVKRTESDLTSAAKQTSDVKPRPRRDRTWRRWWSRPWPRGLSRYHWRPHGCHNVKVRHRTAGGVATRTVRRCR